jgi:hypothetical protein
MTNFTECFLCGGTCRAVIDLPALPLTDSYGTFGKKPPQAPESGVDQQLVRCERCSHCQLSTVIPPASLYTSEYSFRTSTSQSASAGTDFFVAFLDQVAQGRHFDCVLDVGCNDLHLLRSLGSRATHRCGIDPIWSGREHEADPGIVVSGELFEAVQLDKLLPQPASLVVARHTMEHIHRPVDTIKSLRDHASADALFVIEVPGFDALVARRRYDQVFHQHIQYYSRASISQLCRETGMTIVGMAENYHNWGALLVAFQRTNAGATDGQRHVPPSADRITRDYARFRAELADAGAYAQTLDRPIYGYGAAQMLPVIGYHMGTDFSFLDGILDDDPGKDGWGYWNLPVKIQARPKELDLTHATVLITAVDNAAPITRRLLEQRPRHIVNPFHLI